MKNLSAILLCALSMSCSQQTPSSTETITQDTSQTQHYVPGLGEIMSGIQMHHAKLWFAGINSNWKLSEYEINEIREMFEVAKEFETDRPEVNHIPMIYADLNSVSSAIKQKNVTLFKSSFQSLTNTCNSCHHQVNFEFNVVIIPTSPPVTNQDFKVQ